MENGNYVSRSRTSTGESISGMSFLLQFVVDFWWRCVFSPCRRAFWATFRVSSNNCMLVFKWISCLLWRHKCGTYRCNILIYSSLATRSNKMNKIRYYRGQVKIAYLTYSLVIMVSPSTNVQGWNFPDVRVEGCFSLCRRGGDTTKPTVEFFARAPDSLFWRIAFRTVHLLFFDTFWVYSG